MVHEELTLTQALQEFNRTHTAAAADRLHSLFPVSEYIIPTLPVEETAPDQPKTISFLIVQHPEVGNYIPVFTSEEQIEKTSLPSGSSFARLNFDQLVSLLKRSAETIPTLIFDPGDAALVFQKKRFLNYADSLMGNEAAQKKVQRVQPSETIVNTTSAAGRIHKRTIGALKKVVQNDRRIHAVTVARNEHDNAGESFEIIIEANCSDPKMIDKIARLLQPHFSRSDSLNIEVIEPLDQNWKEIPALVRKK